MQRVAGGRGRGGRLLARPLIVLRLRCLLGLGRFYAVDEVFLHESGCDFGEGLRTHEWENMFAQPSLDAIDVLLVAVPFGDDRVLADEFLRRMGERLLA